MDKKQLLNLKPGDIIKIDNIEYTVWGENDEVEIRESSLNSIIESYVAIPLWKKYSQANQYGTALPYVLKIYEYGKPTLCKVEYVAQKELKFEEIELKKQ